MKAFWIVVSIVVVLIIGSLGYFAVEQNLISDFANKTKKNITFIQNCQVSGGFAIKIEQLDKDGVLVCLAKTSLIKNK